MAQIAIIPEQGIEKKVVPSAIEFLNRMRQAKSPCPEICDEVRNGGYCTHCYTGNTNPQNDKLQL